MATRGAKFTIERGKREHFSDFLTNFDKNPVTGYLAKAVDQQAIEISLRNLILTNEGDWPFEPDLGCKLVGALFDFNDSRMHDEIESSIVETVQNHEPRIELHRTIVNGMDDPNRVQVSIVYSILNIPDETFQFDVIVNRVR